MILRTLLTRSARVCFGWAAVLSVAALAGCGSAPMPPLPAEYSGAPAVDGEADRLIALARDAAEGGDDRAALDQVEAALSLDARAIDGQRLRQDILRRRGRIGLVWSEAERRIVEWSGDAEALYLRGRLEDRDVDKQLWFARALNRDPRSFWGWFGMAYTLRESDPERAIAIYRALAASSPDSRVVIPAMIDLSRRFTPEEAREFHADARRRDPDSGIADVAIARYAFGRQRTAAAWAPLLESIRRRPFDADVRAMLQSRISSGINEDQVAQLLDLFGESGPRTERFVAAGGASILGYLFQRAGRIQEALEVLARARPTADVMRVRRRLLLQTGDVVGFLRALDRDLPQAILTDESNQVRSLWARIRFGVWSDRTDPLAESAIAIELVTALIDAGLLVEADTVATLALARGPSAECARQLVDQRGLARREHAFESGLRRMLYLGYGSEPKPLAQFLDEVRGLSERVLGRDVVGQPNTYTVPLVGELIDPFGEGLAAHLRRYNRHLILGQRAGRPPEGMMLTRLSLRDLDDGGPLALAGRAYEIVGDERQIESLEGLLGGDLAGVALLNHYVIDHDAVLDWALSLRERRRILAEDDHAILRDPLPEDRDPLDPSDVAWRLLAVSPAGDNELDAAVLDIVRWHERAHLVDAFRYLPPEANLWRVLGLVAGSGFSVAAVEAELEGRAETAAVAFSSQPELALAHVASFLEDGAGTSAHAIGFRRLARSLTEIFEQDGVDDGRAIAHWFRLEPERMRDAARRVAARQWP